MNTRQQGDIGELSAAAWFAAKRIPVALPVCHAPDWDLVAEVMGALVKVQVKTSTAPAGSARWRVSLCTRGGNQSWSGLVKHFDATRCDYLFAHVGDGRRWLVPANLLDARCAVVLGGPKYAQFEVESGERLPRSTALSCAA